MGTWIAKAFFALADNLAICTYEGQHEVAAMVNDLERPDCRDIIQASFEVGVSNGDFENAIQRATHTSSAQSSQEKP